MKTFLLPLVGTLGLVVTGCAASPPGPAGLAPQAAHWRTVATGNDRRRLRQWRTAWVEALAKASAAGRNAEIAGEGVLLEPDAALAFEAPPTGDYRCRTVKLGAKSAGLLDFIAYPWFACRISARGAMLRLEKHSGSQRPVGQLFADPGKRMIFLGTLVLGDEQRPLDYSFDRDRDMAGILERIGDRRWRLVLPYPAFESTIDVIELVPGGAPS